MNIVPYERSRAVEYALKYSHTRNIEFFDFTDFGGNCTSFVSQCLYFANKVMNPSQFLGWYYYNLLDRSPSWTGVEFFFDFLTKNSTLGPFARTCTAKELELGDIVQLKFYGYNEFTHTLLVTKLTDQTNLRTEKNIYVTANTYDVKNKNLTSYHYKECRFLKILGVYVQ